jgi:hypothetical protein
MESKRVTFGSRTELEVAIMNNPDEPDERASSEKEAELRAFRRIINALEGDDVAELAAALGQVPDPAWPWPEYYARPEEK